MKNILAIGAAAAISALFMQPAFAQDLSVDTSVEAGVSAEVATDSMSNAIDTTYDSLMSTFSAEADAAADLTVVTETTTVHFVTVSSLSGDGSALNAALTDREQALTELRADITANAALSAKLTAEGYTAHDVIAVVANADSSLTVYIDDRA